MKTAKITLSELTGQLPIDPLVDRDCVILDGICKCKEPFKDCKYIERKTNEGIDLLVTSW
jgi:hypothetical protein